MSDSFNESEYFTDKQIFSFSRDAIAFFLVSILKTNNRICYICKDFKEIEKIERNIKQLNPLVNIIKFPEWDYSLFSDLSPTVQNQSIRINSLVKLTNFKTENSICLTSFSSVLTNCVPRHTFKKRYLIVDLEKIIEKEDIITFLNQNSYEKVEVVRQKGEYASRGSVLDIFPISVNNPVRVDFFGVDIDSIRVFDSITQLSKKKVGKFFIFPNSEIFLSKEIIENFRVQFRKSNIENKKEFYNLITIGKKFPGQENFLPFFYEKVETIIDYLTDFTFVFDENLSENLKSDFMKFESFFNNSEYYKTSLFDNLIQQYNKTFHKICSQKSIRISFFSNYNSEKSITVTEQLPIFKKLNSEKSFNNFLIFLKENKSKFKIVFAYINKYSILKLKKIFEKYFKISEIKNLDELVKSEFNFFLMSFEIQKGFIVKSFYEHRIIFISENDLFGQNSFYKTKKKVNAENFIFEISQLSVKDLVVHSEHGIGMFNGLKNININQQMHECIEVEYYGGDKLFIPVENLDLISKYGNKISNINLDKLGSQNWQLRKSSLKNKIKLIAIDLINVAAKRSLRKGKEVFLNSEAYDDFASSFEFAETSDQLNAINDVINDLTSSKPMDRLICGDVGFGKTEVAMRASFILAENGYQVAFICPTTLLVKQHFNNFLSRFKNTKIKIDKISRFESLKQRREIHERIKNNEVQIIIGTHALLNSEIQFKNLGLLIIDEEQSFGVEQKEKIKNLRSDIHILTLTATPIPRTLQFSVLGIKDISLITTPPVNRTAIKTFLTQVNNFTIKNAILNEIKRNGQIYYVTPKIFQIDAIKKKLLKLLPDISIGIAHGRLSNEELNDVYQKFFDKKIDVLICTSIIESGLDIVNANTMIIEKPNFFGLSQIYQIRGRIGRSDKQGFAYLLVEDIEKLTKDAKKRLEIINNLDVLGAGFQLASFDMDLRGSGNILGSEQSGHIREVGFELYQKLIKDAISEIKNDKKDDDWSPVINLGIPVFIPKDYIPEIDLRLNIYRKISRTDSVKELREIFNELRDRFGKIPPELVNLFKIVQIKNLSKNAKIKKIDLGSKGFIISFKEKFNSSDKIIEIVQMNPKFFKFKQDNKLSFIKNWQSKDQAINEVTNFLKMFVNTTSLDHET